MKFIQPKTELWEQGKFIEDIWNHVARCARVCYQTETNGNESGKEFVNRIILKRFSYTEIANDRRLQEKLHLSVLEHGTVYLHIKNTDVNYLDIIRFYTDNKYSVVNFGKDVKGNTELYITTNLRVLIENGRMKDLMYISVRNTMHMPRYTICITTNVGAIRDTNRHRVQSISEESTRYCSYDKDKFDKQIAYAKLPWISDKEYDIASVVDAELMTNDTINMQNTEAWNAVDWYLYICQMTEITYKRLKQLGWTAQQCSNILNFSTKTQSVHTATRTEWLHYIRLRKDEISGKVRPEVKEIAEQIDNIINH